MANRKQIPDELLSAADELLADMETSSAEHIELMLDNPRTFQQTTMRLRSSITALLTLMLILNIALLIWVVWSPQPKLASVSQSGDTTVLDVRRGSP